MSSTSSPSSTPSRPEDASEIEAANHERINTFQHVLLVNRSPFKQIGKEDEELDQENLCSLLEGLNTDEDPELAEKISSLLQRLGGETYDQDKAEFITWCASSDGDHRKALALNLIRLDPVDCGCKDKQEQCLAALAAVITSCLQSDSLQRNALRAAPRFLAAWGVDSDVMGSFDSDVIGSLLHLKYSASDECADLEANMEAMLTAADEQHECVRCCLVMLTLVAPHALAGRLAAVAAFCCESAETLADVKLMEKLVAMLMFVADGPCEGEIRNAFDALIGRREPSAPVFALCLIMAAPSEIFRADELTDFVGSCLGSNEADVRETAADAIGHLAHEEKMGEGEQTAAALLLPQLLQLLQMVDVGPVMECLGTLANDAPKLFLANRPAILAYCSKAVKSCLQDEQQQLMEKKTTIDQKTVFRSIASVVARVNEGDLTGDDSAVFEQVKKALEKWKEEGGEEEESEGLTPDSSVSHDSTSSEKSVVEAI